MKIDIVKKAIEGQSIEVEKLTPAEKDIVHQIQLLKANAQRFEKATEVVGLLRDTFFVGPFVSANQVPVSEGEWVQTDLYNNRNKPVCSVIGIAEKVPGGWGAKVYYKGEWMLVPLYPEQFLVLGDLDVASMVGELEALKFEPPKREA